MTTTQHLFPDSPDLTIIIVNWNVGHLVKNCLKSVRDLTERSSFEIFVIDNCSRDGDLDDVMLRFPDVNYVFLKANLGFAKANNVAIKRARGKYIALLNPDTYLLNPAFDVMTDYLDSHPQVGAVGPKLLTPDGGLQFDAARNLPTLATEFAHNFFVHKLFPRTRLGGSDYIRWWDHLDAREVGALCGACMVVRSEAVKTAGLLDENFFLYWEDVEWCYRIKRAGWKVNYQPAAEVHHLGGHCMAQDAASSLECSYRSAVLYFHKHHGRVAAVAARGLILGGSILRIFLWLALFPLPSRRVEARERLRCYGRTMVWLLSGRTEDVVCTYPPTIEPVTTVVSTWGEVGTREESPWPEDHQDRPRALRPTKPVFHARKGTELL